MSDVPMVIDLRHVLRNLRRSRTSAAVAVFTLSLTLGGAGLVVGGILSIWVARALSSMVFATGQVDLLNVAVAAAVLVAVGVGAVLPTARRAARTDPLSALRSESRLAVWQIWLCSATAAIAGADHSRGIDQEFAGTTSPACFAKQRSMLPASGSTSPRT